MAMVSLNRVLGRKKTFELYYFGESFDAETARRLDLVNWVVPDNDFDEAVAVRAAALAALPRGAVAVGRSTFTGLADRSIAEGYDYSAGRLVELLTDPEAREALVRRKR
jgi:enoyl-CoA hydratase/carnithine racemase